MIVSRRLALWGERGVDIFESVYHRITCEPRFLWTTTFSRRRRRWRPRRARSWDRFSHSLRVAVCGSRRRRRVRVDYRFSKSQRMRRLSRVIVRKNFSPKTRRETGAARYQCAPRARLAKPSTPCQRPPVVSRRSPARMGDLCSYAAWLREALLEPGLHLCRGASTRGRVASARADRPQAAPLLAITRGYQARDLPSHARPSASERCLSHRGGTATTRPFGYSRFQTASACGR